MKKFFWIFMVVVVLGVGVWYLGTQTDLISSDSLTGDVSEVTGELLTGIALTGDTPIVHDGTPDTMTLENLNSDFSRDKNNIYVNARGAYEILLGADVKTFEVLKGCYAMDKNNIYACNRIMEADKATFKALSKTYAIDKNNIYANGFVVKGTDIKTFRVIQDIDEDDLEGDWNSGPDAEDKNHKYILGDIRISDETICTAEYAPVCALVHIQCIKAPCDPIEQTFSNTCVMNLNPLTEFLHEGECE